MSEKDESPAADPVPALEWAKLWQTMAESSNRMVEAWSGSMAPFMARLSEKPAGFGDGNELSAAIERLRSDFSRRCPRSMARRRPHCSSQGAGAFQSRRLRPAPFSGRCPRRRQAAAPAPFSAAGTSETSTPDWREAFAKWSEISNEELIRNQRTDGFLQAQKELLQAGLQLRSRQDDVAETASVMFGLPTRRDFDDVTRQLTELRREVRALARQVRDRKGEGAL